MAASFILNRSHLAAVQRIVGDERLYPKDWMEHILRRRITPVRRTELQDMLAECRTRCGEERPPGVSYEQEWGEAKNGLSDKGLTTIGQAFASVEMVIDLRQWLGWKMAGIADNAALKVREFATRLTNPKQVLYLNAALLVALDRAPDVDSAVEELLQSAELIYSPPGRGR